jgi:hypothetical protein
MENQEGSDHFEDLGINGRIILAHDWMTIDEVWIGNHNYWTQTVTASNYSAIAKSHSTP